MNTRVRKGFFEEKMANLKVFIAKHIVDSTSFTKTVKFTIEICSKMILIGNYFLLTHTKFNLNSTRL